MTTIELKVTGMSCSHCVQAVTTALRNVAGVRSAHVDLQYGRAIVEYDEATATPARLVGAVFDEGYAAEEA